MGSFRNPRWARRLAVVLLLAASCGLVHIDQDDPACLVSPPAGPEAFAGHDETQHALRQGGHEERDHCAVCHWTRTLRAPRPPVSGVLAQAAPPSLVDRPDDRTHAAPVLASLPARAPPSAPL